MANELLNSPAEIIAELLIQLGVGSDPSANPAEAWPVYVDEFNDAIDQQITVQDTLGSPDGRAQVDGSLFCHFGFQVLVRAKHPRDGWRKADEVRQALAAVDGGTGTNAWAGNLVIVVDADGGAHSYSVLSVNQISPVIRNGREPTSARRRWSVNATATIESYAFPAAAAYYPLDDTLVDAGGNGRDLTGTGDTYSAGLFGSSLSTGSGSRANNLLSGDAYVGTYTISAWFYLTTLKASGHGVFFYDASLSPLVSISAHTDATPFASAMWGTGEQIVEVPSLSASTWHHCCLVTDAGVGVLYVDGSLVGTVDLTAIAPADFSTDPDTFSIMVVNNGRARIDDVAVVPAALNSTEVAALWDGGRGRPYPV